MKKKIIKLITFLFILIISSNAYGDIIHFIDFSKVLNQSSAGAEAQRKLKDKLENENKKFNSEEENLKKAEADLISKKKVLSNEDYQKKAQELRNKVSLLQKNKLDSLNSIAKSRASAKQKLLEQINPILKKYMENNNVRIIVDKQSVILGDSSLEITNQIIDILNKEVKSISFN